MASTVPASDPGGMQHPGRSAWELYAQQTHILSFSGRLTSDTTRRREMGALITHPACADLCGFGIQGVTVPSPAGRESHELLQEGLALALPPPARCHSNAPGEQPTSNGRVGEEPLCISSKVPALKLWQLLRNEGAGIAPQAGGRLHLRCDSVSGLPPYGQIHGRSAAVPVSRCRDSSCREACSRPVVSAARNGASWCREPGQRLLASSALPAAPLLRPGHAPGGERPPRQPLGTTPCEDALSHPVRCPTITKRGGWRAGPCHVAHRTGAVTC